MSAKRITRLPGRSTATRLGKADRAALLRMSDEEIAATSPPELADLPAGFWKDARLVVPVPKDAISLRVDRDVLNWFRQQGPRYQSRMNAVLRAYMEHSRSE